MSYRNWKTLHEDCQACAKCDLARYRTHMVFGEGNIHADIMLIGEGPGRVEDETGRPFVGPSGQLLDELLGGIGLRRSDVFIANVVKCRPPGNRDPKPEEIEACFPYLRAQLALVKPKIIVCLGVHAARLVLRRDVRITREHGSVHHVKSFTIIPTYHPAALLHNPPNKPLAEADFQIIGQEVRRLAADEAQSGDGALLRQ
ncbi:MAG: uracil-DNA glycosylase [Clostridia bacterium]|nr:uracil-DNA glycosylase [Clostridia bacterium]